MKALDPMETDEIRILCLNVTGRPEAEASGLLSPDEVERAGRLRDAAAGARFVSTRAFLRRSLGAILGADPKTLCFSYGPQGKPALAVNTGGGAALHFNLSHSGDLAVLALALDRPLGVDVEKIRPVEEAPRLVERYFSPPEAILYRVTPPERREMAFFHFWTAKEAFLKARGEGMTLGLKGYAVSDPEESPPRLTWVGWDEGEAARWRFHRFCPQSGYLGTLAYPGGLAKIREFRDL